MKLTTILLALMLASSVFTIAPVIKKVQADPPTYNIQYIHDGWVRTKAQGIEMYLNISYENMPTGGYKFTVEKTPQFPNDGLPIRIYRNYCDNTEEENPVRELIYEFDLQFKKDIITFTIPHLPYDLEEYEVEFGDNTVVYNGGTDTITVTQGTAAAPVTFAAIDNADNAGGWGQVTKVDGVGWHIDANLQIGDGATWTYFKTQGESALIEGTFATTAMSDTQIGNWDGEHAYKGSYLFFNKTYGSTVYWYMKGNFSVFGSILQAKDGTTRIYFSSDATSNRICYNESEFVQWRGVRFFSDNGQIYLNNCNVWAAASSYGYYVSCQINQTWTGVKTRHRFINNYQDNATIKIWGIDIYKCIEAATIYLYSATDMFHKKLELINPIQLDEGTAFLIYIEQWANDSTFVRINYTFDCRLVDNNSNGLQGYNIRLTNLSGIIMTNQTTDSDGRINQTMLPWKKWYEVEPGDSSPNTIEDNNPYTIDVFSPAGSIVYTYKFNITEALNFTIGLPEECSAASTAADPTSYAWVAGVLMVSGLLLLVKRRKK